MKKYLLVLSSIFFIILKSNAQTTITVGTESNSLASSPIYGNYNYSYNQILYLGSEIAAAGGSSGTITKLRFRVFNPPTVPANSNNWSVYLANSFQTTLTGGSNNFYPAAAMTQVFSGIVTFPAAGNWLEITFTTPFNYTGDNLMIAIDENASGLSNATWYASNTQAIMVRHLYDNTINPDPNSLPGPYAGSSGVAINRPNIQLDITLPSCSGTPTPGNTIASENSACYGRTVDLSLQNSTPGAGVTYQWQRSLNNFTWNNVNGQTDNTYSPLILANTYYRCAVTCSGNTGYSNSKLITSTSAISTYPYLEGFNSIGALPSCWTASEGNSGATQHWQTVASDANNGAGSPAEGGGFLRMNYYLAQANFNPYFLTSPAFELDAIPKRASFSIWMGANSGANNLKFQISINGGVTWTTLANYSANPANTNATAPWENKFVDLSPYVSKTVLFRLNATSNYGMGYVNIGFDNFKIAEPPTCNAPTSLAASNITTSSASLSFNGLGGNTFIVEYGNTGFTPGTAATAGVGGTVITTNSSPVALSGLLVGTNYDVYVRQDCTSDGNGYSANSSKAIFTTLCSGISVPYTQNFETAITPNLPTCTSIQNVGQGNNWVTANVNANGFNSKVLMYSYNTTYPANVWFFTRGLNLTAGVPYFISYKYGNNIPSNWTEKLRVAYGNAADASAMIHVLADHPSISGGNAQTNTVVFTPSSTDTYYFGFKAYSLQNQFYLYVDDIRIDISPWIWTGINNTDWSVASNWNLGSVPNSSSNVVIANTLNRPVLNSGTYLIKNLTVDSIATLTINGKLQLTGNLNNEAVITGTGTLEFNGTSAQTITNTRATDAIVIGTFTSNNNTSVTLSSNGRVNISDVININAGLLYTNGKLVLKSSSQKTARIAPLITGSIAGSITVERFIPSKAVRKWSFISSPVAQTLSNSWQQQIHITGNGIGGTICPSFSKHSNGFDATFSNTPSAYTYDASKIQGQRWLPVPTTNSFTIAAGKGFRVNIRGPRSLGCSLLDGTNMTPSEVTLSSSGTISNESKNLGTFSITYPNVGVDNYVFVGNPYPSAISFSALQASNWASINTNYAVYIPTNAAGVYSYWSDDNGEFTGGSGYDNNYGNIIANGQAVFLQSTVAGAVTLNFNENQKISENNTGYFRPNKVINEKLKISYSNMQEKIDEVVIRYSNDLSVTNSAIGKLDIPSMNSGTYITSLKNNQHLVVQTRALNTLSTDEVGLNIGATQSGNYKFDFSDYEKFINTDIYLIDHLANVTQDVKQQPEYVFSVDVNNNATKGSARFSIVFNKKIQPEIVYNNINLYPNPANKQVTLILPQSADNSINYNIKVTDIAGKTILQQFATGGSNQMNIEKLIAGVYMIEITDNKNNRITKKLVKN